MIDGAKASILNEVIKKVNCESSGSINVACVIHAMKSDVE